MAGLMFVVCVPTSEHERELVKNSRRKSISNSIKDVILEISKPGTPKIPKKDFDNSDDRCQYETGENRSRNIDDSKWDRNKISGSENKSEISKPRIEEGISKTGGKKGLAEVNGVNQSDDKMSMEKVLRKILKKQKIENASWCPGENEQYFQVFFSVGNSDQCEEVLKYFSDHGIGYKLNSVVSVIPCSLHYEAKQLQQSPEFSPSEEMMNERRLSAKSASAWDRFLMSVRARLTVAQVVEGVKADATLTFDFLTLLIISGIVAALGLVENSSVVLVASMLISPLMGPIMAGTFGTVIGDRNLQMLGIVNELIGLIVCIIVGCTFGLVAGSVTGRWGSVGWPTPEMISRGMTRSLWVGSLIAFPSGAAVALAILGDNTASLVGVAISASLMPPAVNAGLLWALALMDVIWPGHMKLETIRINATDSAYNPVYSDTPSVELAILGALSLCLTLVNIACIFIAGIIVLKIKEVAPRTSKDQEQQFWKHDIKLARDYNKTLSGQDADDLKNRLAEEFEIQKTLTGMTPTMYNRLRSLTNSGPYLGAQEIFNPPIIHVQRTWSPSTTGKFGDHKRPPLSDLENLYSVLAVNNQRDVESQAPPSRKRRHSGFSIGSKPWSRKLSAVSMAPSVPSNSGAGLGTITEAISSPKLIGSVTSMRSLVDSQAEGGSDTQSMGRSRFTVSQLPEPVRKD